MARPINHWWGLLALVFPGPVMADCGLSSFCYVETDSSSLLADCQWWIDGYSDTCSYGIVDGESIRVNIYMTSCIPGTWTLWKDGALVGQSTGTDVNWIANQPGFYEGQVESFDVNHVFRWFINTVNGVGPLGSQLPLGLISLQSLPTNDGIQVTCGAHIPELAAFQVISVDGRVLYDRVHQLGSGVNRIELHFATLPRQIVVVRARLGAADEARAFAW